MRTFDYILVGGGLQNGLIALALFHKHPDVRILLVEQSHRLGGNHTWSFHETDVPNNCRDWVEPLIIARWPEYLVRFPNRTRQVKIGYQSISSERFHAIISEQFKQHPGSQILFESTARQVEPHLVRLSTGEEFTADLVVDARGPEGKSTKTGYQKFVGWEIELAEPMRDLTPVVMDACTPQIDGYRFFYVLPFTPTRVLVEETYFSDTPDLDVWAVEPRLDAYLDEQKLRYTRILRKEEGVLPMPWGKPPEPKFREGVIIAGFRGGWFHPATGYSFPIAVSLAQRLADTPRADIQQLWRTHEKQARFARLLNYLLFRAFPPARRWNVFERFYGFSESMISRFYSLRLTLGDKVRLLSGRPPKGMSIRHFWRGGE